MVSLQRAQSTKNQLEGIGKCRGSGREARSVFVPLSVLVTTPRVPGIHPAGEATGSPCCRGGRGRAASPREGLEEMSKVFCGMESRPGAPAHFLKEAA